MGMRAKLHDILQKARKRGRAYQEMQNKFYLDALCSAYENVFAQVRPLVNEMKTVIPYGVRISNKPLPPQRTPELLVLQDPNDDMGWAEFADAMFTTWLTEDELNVHVWRNGRGEVYGYSILPVEARKQTGDKTYFEYTTNTGTERLEENEVATLRYSRNPHNLDKGVSPASAIYIWTQIDDLIAQYQRAYFENGAVPAYITTIRAFSREKYEAAKAALEKGLKGAKNRNKTIYIWRQYLDDGSEADEVEVRTIQGNNSTLALKEILEAVHSKINKAYGVSNFIMGDDASAKYDNAELSDRNFAKRQVYPALMSFWSQFQHELDRITGGLGYQITFDYEIPELTDRKKTWAEIAEKNAGTLEAIITAGARPSAAVAALGLEDSWLEVADGMYDRVLAGRALESAQNDSSTGGTRAEAKTKTFCKTSPTTPYDSALHNSSADTTRDKLKNEAEQGELTQDGLEYTPIFEKGDENAKVVYDALRKMLVDAIRAELGDVELDEAELDKIIDVIVKASLDEAEKGAEKGSLGIQGLLAGKDNGAETAKAIKNDGFQLSKAFEQKWQERTERLVKNYHADVQDKLREILDNTRAVSRQQLQKELEEVVPAARAEMIARSETAEAFRQARLETDKNIASKYGLKIGKKWRTHHDGTTCDLCEAMDGQIVELHEAFPDHVEGKDADGNPVTYAFDQNEWNNDGESPNAHPRCRCDFVEVMLDE